jgi:hypothetical protein
VTQPPLTPEELDDAIAAQKPAPGDNTFFGTFFDYLSHVGEGLDGTSIELSHASIGADGNPETQHIGRAVRLARRIDIEEWPSAISAYDRQLLKSELKGGSDESEETERVVVESLREANLLSSALVGPDGEPTGYHTLAIDVDLPVRVRETDTEGHYHLFIDAPMPWETYSKLLDALVEAGIVEEGFAGASKSREATHLRLPWVHKLLPDDELTFTAASPPPPSVLISSDGRPVHNQIAFPETEAAHIEFDPESYVVEYVDGKGVLRRRK